MLENYQNRFQYIMVDEYQDTNNAQFELVKLLAGKRKNICVVGDDDQSIYKFRGANIQNILNFEKVFRGAKVIKLEQNYRSTQYILNAANAGIANNKGRKAKALWTDRKDGEPVYFRQYGTGKEEAEEVVGEIGALKDKNQLILVYCRSGRRSKEAAQKLANLGYNNVKEFGGIIDWTGETVAEY